MTNDDTAPVRAVEPEEVTPHAVVPAPSAPAEAPAEAPAKAPANHGTPLLEARGVFRHYPARHSGLLGHRAVVHAVDDVSLALHRGRITAVVGESGSGKSTIARVLARLEPPTKGELLVGGQPVGRARGAAFRRYLGQVQMIFQDPFASLNPFHTVEHHLARPL
jgi:peptide/nickel transport system ATP-binding protein